MVQTRSQWQDWRNLGFPSSQSSTSSIGNYSLPSVSQGSGNSYRFSQDSLFDIPYYRRDGNIRRNSTYPHLAPDDCHRHRKPDNQPKTEEVRGYRRRT